MAENDKIYSFKSTDYSENFHGNFADSIGDPQVNKIEVLASVFGSIAFSNLPGLYASQLTNNGDKKLIEKLFSDDDIIDLTHSPSLSGHTSDLIPVSYGFDGNDTIIGGSHAYRGRGEDKYIYRIDNTVNLGFKILISVRINPYPIKI